MRITLNDKAKAAIETAINRGNNVEVRRDGPDVVVFEVKKKIKYGAGPIGATQGQLEPTTE